MRENFDEKTRNNFSKIAKLIKLPNQILLT